MPVYRIVCCEVDTDATPEGLQPVEIETATYATEALTPWDAVVQWADQLSLEEAS